jgi:hypothetical protein
MAAAIGENDEQVQAAEIDGGDDRKVGRQRIGAGKVFDVELCGRRRGNVVYQSAERDESRVGASRLLKK